MIVHTTVNRAQLDRLLGAIAAITGKDLSQDGDSGQQLEFPGLGGADRTIPISPDDVPDYSARIDALNTSFGNQPPPLSKAPPGPYFEALRDLVHLKREGQEPCSSVEEQEDYMERAETAWSYAEALVDNAETAEFNRVVLGS